MQIKKKLALLLASALLVTSINVMPVEASTSNQATGSENENAVVNTDLTLSIAALNSNQGNTVTNATGNTVLSLAVEELVENQGNTAKNATGSTNLTLQVAALNDNQGNTKKEATGSTTLTLVIEDHKWEYKADGNTIKAYCSAKDYCNNNGESKAVSLTLTASDMTYSGIEYTGANVTNNITSVTGATAGDITYYLSNGTTKTNTANSGATGEGKAPKDAGEYVAKVDVNAGSDTYTATKTFKITPKSLTANVSVKNKNYDGTTSAEVTATVDSGIEGQSLTITGLTGTFSDSNVATNKPVTIDSSKAQIAGGKAGNYNIAYATSVTATISAEPLTVTVRDVEKHIGYDDPTFTYTITAGNLVDGETLRGISYLRTAGETAGEYEITASETAGSNPNYVLTLKSGKLTIVDHTWDSGVVSQQPVCTVDGRKVYTCTVCKKTKEEVMPKLGHDFSGDFTVDKAASCTEEGSKSKHCSRCDEVTEVTVIPAPGHTVVTDKAVEASCTEAGKTEGSHCSVCNTVIKAQEEVKALGHDYSEWTVKKAATCTEDGQKTRKCSRCDEAETQTIKAPGHTVVTDKAVEASCTEAGKTEGSHCSVCNTVIKAQEEVKALGHDYSEWTVKKAATCTEDGQKTRKCSRCDEAETQTIKAPGHTVVTDAEIAPTCTESGKTEGSHCSVCNTVIKEQKEVPAHGHDWTGEWTITKPATTTVEGKKELSCKNGCNQKKYQVISIIGTPTDPDEGKLEKDAEVSLKAPIKEATLDNSKKEILDAPAIFTETEKTAIEGGGNARVWLEVTDTDESSISSEDKTKISEAATSIMGESPEITYFDADLFKQVGDGETKPIHEPGIEIGVTIKIPDELINTDKTYEREYKIIRLHTDVATGASLVDILSGTFDKITGEFKFKTDKFSTYAIAYTDKKLVTGVTLTPETATLTQAGQSVQLTATVAPADATDKSVTWTSSNTKVATVDANGKVTAVANGTCTITVTTVDGSKSATSTITVKIPATESGNSGNSTDNTGNTGNTNNTNNNQTQNSTVTNTSDKSGKKDVISAKTGDSNAPILWTSVLLMSMTALAILFTRRKRNIR